MQDECARQEMEQHRVNDNEPNPFFTGISWGSAGCFGNIVWRSAKRHVERL